MTLPASRAVTRTSTGWPAVTELAKTSTSKWVAIFGAVVVVVVEDVVVVDVDVVEVDVVVVVGGGPVGTTMALENPRTVEPGAVSEAATVWLPEVARLAASVIVRRPASPAVKV